MKKIIICIFFGLLLIGIFSTSAFAVSTPAPTSPPSNLSSFELFWPIVAGKTMDESLYFLKSLKEKVRGMFIFGSSQKANYELLLATKRVVEAEKLINEGKTDYANKTLDVASQQLDKASLNLDKALSMKVSFQEQALDMTNKLSNLEVFIPWLMNKADKNKEILSKVLEKVNLLSEKIQ